MPNTEWALGQLGEYLRLVRRTQQGISARTDAGSEEQIAAQQVVAEQIWERMIGPRRVGRWAAGIGSPPQRE